MKQLFVVQLTYEVVIVADDAAAAERISNTEHIDRGEADTVVRPLSYLPADWDKDSIPFGDRVEEDPDRTVGQWIELGAAPDYVTFEKLRRFQKKDTW